MALTQQIVYDGQAIVFYGASNTNWSSLAQSGTSLISNATTFQVNALNLNAGAVTNGSWQGTPVAALYGGTGLSSTYVVGDILYASASGPTNPALSRLPIGTQGQFLVVQSGAPAWGSTVANLTVTGNLMVIGATTTLEKNTLSVTDQNISVNVNGSTSSANGAGLTVFMANSVTTTWNSGALVLNGTAGSPNLTTTVDLTGTIFPGMTITSNGNVILVSAITSSTITAAANLAASPSWASGPFAFTYVRSASLIWNNSLLAWQGGLLGAEVTLADLTSVQTFSTGAKTFTGGVVFSTTNVTLTSNMTGAGYYQAGTIVTTYGGTGLASYTAGDLLWYSTGTTLSKLAISGTAGRYLISAASSISWSSIITDDASKLNIAGGISFTGGQTITTTSTGILSIAPTGALALYSTSTAQIQVGTTTYPTALNSWSYASETTGWGINSIGGADFRSIYADEMHVKSFIADQEQALAGSQVITPSVAPLWEATAGTAFTAPSATNDGSNICYFKVESFSSSPTLAVFANGDMVRIRTFVRTAGTLTVADCWGTVILDILGAAPYGATGFDTATNTQRYKFTRSVGTIGAGNVPGGMAPGTTVNKGALVLDYGVSGNGFIESNAVDGASGVNSPYTQNATWTTHPVTGLVVRTRTGQLKGITSVSEYGFYAGDGGITNTSKYIRLAGTNFEVHNIPINLYNSSGTNTISLDPVGLDFALGAALPTNFTTGDGIWMGRVSDTNYSFRVGKAGAQRMAYDGTSGSETFTIYNASSAAIFQVTGTTVQIAGSYVDATHMWSGASAMGSANMYEYAPASGTAIFAVGASASTISMTSGNGIYMDGAGNFKAGVANTSGIFWNGTTNIFSVISNSVTTIFATASATTIAGWTATGDTLSSASKVYISTVTQTAAAGTIKIDGANTKMYLGSSVILDGGTTGIVTVGAGTNKIVLTGAATDGATTILIGTGGYNSATAKFYADATGQFSLGQGLLWSGSALTVAGTVNASGGWIGGTTSGWSIGTNTISNNNVILTANGAVGATGLTIADSTGTRVYLTSGNTWRQPTASTSILTNGNFEGTLGSNWVPCKWPDTGSPTLPVRDMITPHGNTQGVVSATVVAGGTNYAVNDIFTINGTSGTPATFIVTGIGASPYPMTACATMLKPGSGYTSTTGLTTTSLTGSGVGATVNITCNTSSIALLFTTGYNVALTSVNQLISTPAIGQYELSFYGYIAGAAQVTANIYKYDSGSTTLHGGSDAYHLVATKVFTVGSTWSEYTLNYYNPDTTAIAVEIVCSKWYAGTTSLWIDDVSMIPYVGFSELNTQGLQVYSSPTNFLRLGRNGSQLNIANLQTSNLNITSDLTVGGRLYVYGGQTIIGSTTVATPLQVLNSGATLPGSGWAGIEVDNNTSTGPALLYDVTAGRWRLGARTAGTPGTQASLSDTGGNYGNIMTTTSTDTVVQNKTFDSTNTWNGGGIGVLYGGTGLSSFTQYSLLYASATTTIGQIGIGTANYALCVNSSANGYSYRNLDAISRFDYVVSAGGLTQNANLTGLPTYVMLAAPSSSTRTSAKYLVYLNGRIQTVDTYSGTGYSNGQAYTTNNSLHDNDYFETGVNSIAFNEDIAQGGKITVIVFNW